MRAPVTRKPRKARIDREGLEQQAFFVWLYARHREAWRHTFHPPNGGHRHVMVAIEMKSQGVKAGVPDICMDYPRGGYHGLRIELKATPPHDAAVSSSQIEWRDRLAAAGYRAVVCMGLEAAKAEVERYLGLGPFDGASRLPD